MNQLQVLPAGSNCIIKFLSKVWTHQPTWKTGPSSVQTCVCEREREERESDNGMTLVVRVQLYKGEPRGSLVWPVSGMTAWVCMPARCCLHWNKSATGDIRWLLGYREGGKGVPSGGQNANTGMVEGSGARWCLQP